MGDYVRKKYQLPKILCFVNVLTYLDGHTNLQTRNIENLPNELSVTASTLMQPRATLTKHILSVQISLVFWLPWLLHITC